MAQSIYEQIGGTYRKHGDYYLPNLTHRTAETYTLGKYGRMRKTHLMEHHEGLFSHMLLGETLYPHLQEIDRTANRRMEQMMKELTAQSPPPDKMKHQMEWVAHMNSLHAQAEEVILAEIVYI